MNIHVHVRKIVYHIVDDKPHMEWKGRETGISSLVIGT